MQEAAQASPGTVRQQVLEFFPEPLRRRRDVRAIAGVLGSFAAADSLETRLDALHAAFDWIRRRRECPYATQKMREVPAAHRRIALLIEILESCGAARRALQQAVADVVAETEGANLLGEAGLPSERGFVNEFADRLIESGLPRPRDDHDLASVLARLFRSDAHVAGFVRLPLGLFGRLVDLLSPDDRPGLWSPVRKDFIDGFRLLATRVRAQGLAEKLRARSTRVSVAESPFFRLTNAADALADAWARKRHDADRTQECRELIVACRQSMAEVSKRIEASGVSVDVVYGLEVLERCLTRMSQMISLMQEAPDEIRVAQVHDFLSRLITASHQDRSVRHLMRSSLQLLQRKIVERSSKTGEHYVASDRAEYRHIWLAAAGGGAVAALMAVAKFPVLAAGLPPFVEGLMASAVYVTGFMVMHSFGLVLATKQPAMTAATLAGIVREHRGGERLDYIAEFVVRISRSQLAATLSNIVVASLAAFAFDRLWSLGHDASYLSREEAIHVYESMNPLASGTIAYAAFTGVLLWLASLGGGWLDNWSAYHRIAQAIADHPIGNRIGWKRTARLAGIWSRNIADWGTNIALGVLLGMVPVILHFFGIPFDVRHVTLSTGKLMVACAALGGDWYEAGPFLLALAGVAAMFVLNLGVSFLLALNTAMRAYQLPRHDLIEVLRRVGRRAVSTPLAFVWPPREPSPQPPGAPEHDETQASTPGSGQSDVS